MHAVGFPIVSVVIVLIRSAAASTTLQDSHSSINPRDFKPPYNQSRTSNLPYHERVSPMNKRGFRNSSFVDLQQLVDVAIASRLLGVYLFLYTQEKAT
ncbi:hypothetical protein BJ878DRAFT_526139 [Calycina marina]|uniref:Uncharacterized protein n=1 Tax=Calycina marina TaxID=1763456 RepID=A0A9P7YVH1_9HELO|nr:hypothetical protein BJ878DRAFT_526139 [Calycina marina]